MSTIHIPASMFPIDRPAIARKKANVRTIHEFMVGEDNILSTGIQTTNEARHDRLEDNIQECVICMDEISSSENNEPIARLSSCPHIFHANCVEKWRVIGSNGNLCPVCRVPMDVDVAPVPPRLTGNRHTQHRTRRFLPTVASELRRYLSTIIYWFRSLMIWLTTVQPSRPLRQGRDLIQVLMLAGKLLLVNYFLRYLFHAKLIKPVLEFLFHALMIFLDALFNRVIPLILVIIFFGTIICWYLSLMIWLPSVQPSRPLRQERDLIQARTELGMRVWDMGGFSMEQHMTYVPPKYYGRNYY